MASAQRHAARMRASLPSVNQSLIGTKAKTAETHRAQMGQVTGYETGVTFGSWEIEYLTVAVPTVDPLGPLVPSG